jgi:hypothetical protein
VNTHDTRTPDAGTAHAFCPAEISESKRDRTDSGFRISNTPAKPNCAHARHVRTSGKSAYVKTVPKSSVPRDQAQRPHPAATLATSKHTTPPPQPIPFHRPTPRSSTLTALQIRRLPAPSFLSPAGLQIRCLPFPRHIAPPRSRAPLSDSFASVVCISMNTSAEAHRPARSRLVVKNHNIRKRQSRKQNRRRFKSEVQQCSIDSMAE